jgi:hypothetical protein
MNYHMYVKLVYQAPRSLSVPPPLLQPVAQLFSLRFFTRVNLICISKTISPGLASPQALRSNFPSAGRRPDLIP